MNKYLVPFILFFLLGINCNVSAQNLTQTIKQVKNSIVGVGTVLKTRSPPAKLLATGFVVGNGTSVVTNAHAVNAKIDTQRQEKWVVFVGSGKQADIRFVKNIKTDTKHDLALLEIEGSALNTLNIGDSNKVMEGEQYVFTGFPIGAVLGLYPATHRAMISAITPLAIPLNQSSRLNPELIQRLRAPFNVFQLDATAYPGNSGSPLYDPNTGIVYGVINMVFVKESRETVLSKPSGISFAIPSHFILDLMSNEKP